MSTPSQRLSSATDVLPIVGREVTRCQVDYAFTLELADPDGTYWWVSIHAPFDFDDGQKRRTLDPEVPTQVGHALTVLHSSVVSARNVDGVLTLVFSSQATIVVRPDPSCEAWEAGGPNGLLWVCTASGEVYTWS